MKGKGQIRHEKAQGTQEQRSAGQRTAAEEDQQQSQNDQDSAHADQIAGRFEPCEDEGRQQPVEPGKPVRREQGKNGRVIVREYEEQAQQEEEQCQQEEIEAAAQRREPEQRASGEDGQRSHEGKQGRNGLCADYGEQNQSDDQTEPQPGGAAVFPAGAPQSGQAPEGGPPVHEQGQRRPGQADQQQSDDTEPPGQECDAVYAFLKLMPEDIHDIIRMAAGIEYDEPCGDQQDHEQKADQAVSAVEPSGSCAPDQEQNAGDQRDGKSQRPLDQRGESREQEGEGQPEGRALFDPAAVETDQRKRHERGEQHVRIHGLAHAHEEEGSQSQQPGRESRASIVTGGAGQKPD